MVTRYLIAAEPAVMSAPAGAVMVTLSRWVMTGLPWCRARWKDRRCDAHGPDSDSRAPAGRAGPAGGDRRRGGVTIHGLAAFTGEGRGVVHMLLDDEAVAGCRTALERAGMGIADTREVFVIDVEDRPAALGELTRRLAEANVNVDLAYTTFTGGKIVIATDDVGSARSVLRA